jgi:glycosyltransferase involved in cell wall biosynthesis
MKVCVISSKVCWQDAEGLWKTDGGFPIQMSAIASLFDEMDLLIIGSSPRSGGLSIPPKATVIPLDQPYGADMRRKISVFVRLPYYASNIARRIGSADVVHLPVPGDIPTLGFLLALLLRKRLLVRYCGSWAKTAQTTWMNRIVKTGMKLLAGPRSVMLVTGEGSKPPAPKLHWIFATALSKSEVDAIRPNLERGLSNPPRLVYLGRLSQEKGIEVLLEALSGLKRDGFCPVPRLTVVGDGPQRNKLERAVRKLGCGDLVHFSGQLTRTEMRQVLSDSDLCVQPSLTEGFSKAWLDAMAFGLPVLASNVGAAEAVIGADGLRGWLTPPGDPTELARRLRIILKDVVDWPALRTRCRAYAQVRTIEAWSARIGELCALQWNMRTDYGRLRQ